MDATRPPRPRSGSEGRAGWRPVQCACLRQDRTVGPTPRSGLTSPGCSNRFRKADVTRRPEATPSLLLSPALDRGNTASSVIEAVLAAGSPCLRFSPDHRELREAQEQPAGTYGEKLGPSAAARETAHSPCLKDSPSLLIWQEGEPNPQLLTDGRCEGQVQTPLGLHAASRETVAPRPGRPPGGSTDRPCYSPPWQKQKGHGNLLPGD